MAALTIQKNNLKLSNERFFVALDPIEFCPTDFINFKIAPTGRNFRFFSLKREFLQDTLITIGNLSKQKSRTDFFHCSREIDYWATESCERDWIKT